VVLVRCAVRAAAPPSLSDNHALTLTARNSERRYRRRYTLHVYPSPVPSYYHIRLILHTCVVVCMNVALHQETPLRLLLRTKCLKLPSARRVFHGTRGQASRPDGRVARLPSLPRAVPARAPRARAEPPGRERCGVGEAGPRGVASRGRVVPRRVRLVRCPGRRRSVGP